MSNSEETEKKIHPLRRDWFRISLMSIYTIGFIAILVLFVIDILNQPDQTSSKNQTNSSQQEVTEENKKSNTPNQGPAEQKKESKTSAKTEANKVTLTTLIVQPIVSNPIVMSIIKHIFYLLVWIFLFLLFPVAFTRLKRLKFFNFEFEVEKQEEKIINVLNVTTQKIHFLSRWATEEYANGFAEVAKDYDNIEKGIELVLNSLVSDHYLKIWECDVEFKVVKKELFYKDKKIPRIVKRTYEAASKRVEAIPINKENKDHIYLRNFLLTVVDYEEEEYAVILSSFDLEFDEYDAILLSGLVSLALQYYERTEMLEVLEGLDAEEA